MAVTQFAIECKVLQGWSGDLLRHQTDRRLPLFRWALGPATVHEPGFGYTSILERAPDNVVLVGNWQSENYLRGHEDFIRTTLVPLSALREQEAQLLAKIQGCHSASIHLRRGDYVSNRETMAFHGVCSLAYYKEAISVLREKGVERFFVFSDDKAWAASHFQDEKLFTIVDLGEESQDSTELWLMSRCEHQVTANSSFSWWASWMNPSSAKTVIMPEPWFRTTDLDSSTLYPAGVLKLPSGVRE